jgi:hypothetical protein
VSATARTKPFVQEAANESQASATTIAVTLPGVLPGSVLWVVAAEDVDNTMTIADTLGLTWVDMGSVVEAAITTRMQHWYAKVPSGGSTTITITFSVATVGRYVYALEMADLDPTTPNDGSAEVTDTGSNPTTNQTITNTAQPAYMLSAGFDLQGTGYAPGTGMTLKATAWNGSGHEMLVQFKKITSTGAQSANFANAGLDRNVNVAAMFTLAAVGPVGTLSQTLGAATLSGAATVDVQGSSAPTLAALTLSGAGQLAGPIATATPTLGVLALSGAAAVAVQGSGTPTLGTLTLSGAGPGDGCKSPGRRAVPRGDPGGPDRPARLEPGPRGVDFDAGLQLRQKPLRRA